MFTLHTTSRAISNSEESLGCHVPIKSLRFCFEDLLVLGLVLLVLALAIWVGSNFSWSKPFCARTKRRSRRLTIPMESTPLTPSCGLKGGYTPGPSELDPFHVVDHSLDASLILGNGSLHQLSTLQPVLDPSANIPRQGLGIENPTPNNHASSTANLNPEADGKGSVPSPPQSQYITDYGCRYG